MRTQTPGPRQAIAAYEQGQYDGVLITATGCSAALKDYAHLFAGDPVWEPRAAKFAAAARDFAELCTPLEVTPPLLESKRALRVAYHPACTLQNSLKLNGVGEALLAAAGFTVTPFLESHLCCGSAGTYSILQPDLSSQLRARKLGNIAAAEPDVLVSGNIGCLQHLAAGEGLDQPILHIAELLDWAEGRSGALGETQGVSRSSGPAKATTAASLGVRRRTIYPRQSGITARLPLDWGYAHRADPFFPACRRRRLCGARQNTCAKTGQRRGTAFPSAQAGAKRRGGACHRGKAQARCSAPPAVPAWTC